MGAGRRRPGRRLLLPHRPGLGRGPVRPQRGAPRHLVHPRGRVPPRGRPVRRRTLRHLAARGPGDGPAAAARPGDLLGTPRTRRARPPEPQGQPHRRLHGRHVPRLRLPPRRRPRRAGGVRRQRQRGQHRLRARRVHLRPGGPGGHRRHRLLLLPRRPALGHPLAAPRRMRPRRGRRRHRHVHPAHLRGVQPAAGARRRRPLQVLRRGGGRHRLGRRRGPAPAGEGLRRPPQRPPDPRRAARLGRQPGRRLPSSPRTGRTGTPNAPCGSGR